MNYEIKGGNLPVVICSLNEGEMMITESGAMSWMSPNMKMETTSGGGLRKMFGRMMSGEKLFQNHYTAMGGRGMIAFASIFPGSIMPVEIGPGREIIAQKTAFLASEAGVELSIFFRKNLGSGFFGGEGFIMQKLSGMGTAFLEIDGSVVEYELKPGQQIVVDTGYVAAMDGSVRMDIQEVPGLKNMFFGGEGVFNTLLTGPGHIWLQTMPISGTAAAMAPYLPLNDNN